MFFSFVIDVFSRMVVGWQFARHMRTTLVLDAVRMALGLRAPGADVALVHHSDRGSVYTSADYTQTLDDHDLTRSLGSTGDCYDNALAESFVDSFKTELISDRVWRTHDQAELAIVGRVGWFNHPRLHSSLGDTPPAEYEQRHAVAHGSTRSTNLARRSRPRPGFARVASRGPASVSLPTARSLPSTLSPLQPGSAHAATTAVKRRTGHPWPLRRVVKETYSLTQTSKPTTSTSTTNQPT